MAIDVISKCITLPNDFCTFATDVDELINYVFPQLEQNYKNQDWLCERALLALKNAEVNSMNFNILNRIAGNTVTYTSIDTATNQDDVVNYPIEFLNSLDIPGIPPHRLELKVEVPIILLRNINPPRLCNGTRLVVNQFEHQFD